MPASYVAAAAASTGFASNLVCSVPSGVADGDLMLALWFVNSTAAQSLPTGWTEVDDYSPAYGRIVSGWRVASGEPASYTFTASIVTNHQVAIAAWRGGAVTGPEAADTTNIYNSAGSAADKTLSMPSLTATTLAADLGLVMSRNIFTGVTPAADTPSWTERLEVLSTPYRQAADRTLTGTGATGVSGWTVNGLVAFGETYGLRVLWPPLPVAGDAPIPRPFVPAFRGVFG